MSTTNKRYRIVRYHPDWRRNPHVEVFKLRDGSDAWGLVIRLADESGVGVKTWRHKTLFKRQDGDQGVVDHGRIEALACKVELAGDVDLSQWVPMHGEDLPGVASMSTAVPWHCVYAAD